MIVKIKEDGKTFIATLPYKFSGDTNKVVWERKDLDRKFRYVRCEFCGKLIAQRSAGWYSHYEKHLTSDVEILEK